MNKRVCEHEACECDCKPAINPIKNPFREIVKMCAVTLICIGFLVWIGFIILGK